MNRHHHLTKLFLQAILLLTLAGSTHTPVPAEDLEMPGLDTNTLAETENLTESLANFLLEFSREVKSLDSARLSPYFADTTELRLPDANLEDTPEKIKWIRHGHQDLTVKPVIKADQRILTGSWSGMLDQFSSMEDARFKIKNSEFKQNGNQATGICGIKFFLVGRDREARRLWIKGTGHMKASGGLEEGWKIINFEIDDSHAYLAESDLFSEISNPSGLALSLPSYGSPGNDNFVYHGAAAADLDNDGYTDIIATGIKDNFIYMNQGNGTFENVSWSVGIPPNSNLTAPLPLDFDNDGDTDLYFSSTGPQMLFENRLVPDGTLAFIDISLESGVARPAHGFSAVAGDVNNDGYPDIYVAGYNRYGFVMPNSWHRATNGTANLLFINQGDGTFSEQAENWGVRDTRWSYAAQFADLNRDGLQDLYVANDFGENSLYINQGHEFIDQAAASGIVDPGNGMGVSISDYNNDGNLDVLVTNMSSTAGNRILNRLYPDTGPDNSILRKISAGSNLYRGNSDGTFTDVTQPAGPFSLGWSWGGVFMDFDNDGWEDIYISSGFVSGNSMKDT